MELNYEVDNNYENIELDNWKQDSIKGFMSKNCLNDLFFSNSNMTALQIGMKNMVANATNGKTIIKKQSEIELKIIMRSIYLQYGKNLDEDVVEQVKDLNKKVLDYSVPKILSEVEQYKKYIIDASNLHIPITHSENVSNKGSKTLYRDTLF
jgi:O-phosphoseryl-tRNA(Cys) synthetase